MENHSSNKVSASVRNAINANSHQTHELANHVKALEAERNMHLLNLKVKRDSIVLVSPIAKANLEKSPNVSRLGSLVPHRETEKFYTALTRNEEGGKSRKGYAIPPLHLDRINGIATPPRVRKLPSMSRATSPSFASQNLFGQPSNKLLTRKCSSPHKLSGSSPPRDAVLEETGKCKQQLSSRLVARTNVAASALVSTTDSGQLQKQPSSPSNGVENVVHRGLLLRRVSSSKEQSKAKETKTASVFKRLYVGNKKLERTNLRGLKKGNDEIRDGIRLIPKLDQRRRSISLPDLTQMLESLKTCRYLRGSSFEDDQSDRDFW